MNMMNVSKMVYFGDIPGITGFGPNIHKLCFAVPVFTGIATS